MLESLESHESGNQHKDESTNYGLKYRCVETRSGFRPRLTEGSTLFRPSTYFWCKSLVLFGLVLATMWPNAINLAGTGDGRYFSISPDSISEQISNAVVRREFPASARISGAGIDADLRLYFTLDMDLQREAERLLQKHNPDYAVFVALDPDTGRVLAMADSSRAPLPEESLVLRNTFPAASVSKLVTAVSALDQGVVDVNTVIPFNGKTTSLYKKNVFRHKDNKWTRKPTFRESFAKSNNTVFGRVGAVSLGGEQLLDYFHRLGFNARFTSDFRFPNGIVELDTSDDWQVAESASGYTRRNTLSPMHAATLAATAVNGGKMIAPALVDRVTGPQGIPLYVYEDPAVSPAMQKETADKLKQLMTATVTMGSARRAFRGFHRKAFRDVVVGGKTGSLTGTNPPGRYDWFVGFAERGNRKIAFATLCINKEKWYVRSTRLSRELLEFFFRPPQAT